jgi:hypothetical protein
MGWYVLYVAIPLGFCFSGDECADKKAKNIH